jgi:thioredoxin
MKNLKKSGIIVKNYQIIIEVNMEHLTLDTFKEKICECGLDGGQAEWKYKGKVPAVIDFYADWCGPCKMVAPVLEGLEEDYKGKVSIYKVDTEKEQELAGMFGIRSIPALLFIPMEGKPQMVNGAIPKPEFVKIFKEILKVE